MLTSLATYGNAWLATRSDEYRLVWYAVAAIVLFALGVTIVLGAIAYCSMNGMYFGAVYKASTYTYSVGCHKP